MTDGKEAAFARTPLAMSGSEWENGSAGITKREYFAAMAMSGLLVNQHLYTAESARIKNMEAVYIVAVESADSLIKVLNQQ